MSDYKFLNDSDLNDFKLKLNDLNDNLTRAGKKLVIAKSKFSKREVEKDFVNEYVNQYKNAKKRYLEGCKDERFYDNLKTAKLNLSKTSKQEENYNTILNQYKKAKLLYKGYKETVKERGFGGELNIINNTALKLNDIKFKYRENHPFAVDGVSVKIEHGNYVAIIGHNGSGKSTLSKIIIGVLEPTQGSIEVYGNKVTKGNINIIRKFLGIVFQNPDNQFIGSTVRDDIAFGLENRRVAPSKMNEIIINAAKKVNMENFLDHEPLMLSGGQKQRVAIASALALSPNILIFDEATSMLDPKGKSEVKQIMVELKNTREKTIFSITHDMDEILNADKVMVMNKGKLVRFGSPKEILSDKNFLRSIHLDIPFVAQVEEALQNVGIEVSGSENLDELVEKICQI
ncbi:energy-coupling factor transport system ATP-binding protein [Spiroplasma corruscae]|uniref:Energy-coupling factor transport system ATP-binding protein n=1 Tax=Spiroplasma corruscae TaxID=216934 RepID=A0A222ER17_9MOLU|nr:energy-coupling factor transporter ATPase [Spiroplasma corruscae]ASP28684.1 energy-coupling factor transport system ATP-binding protein [Spiroplasma corruscae]